MILLCCVSMETKIPQVYALFADKVEKLSEPASKGADPLQNLIGN